MIAASFWSAPLVSALLVGLVGLLSVAIAFLGYKRSVRQDAVAEKAGIATAHTTSIGQVMTGLQAIIDALHKDNVALRDDVDALRERVDAIRSRLDAVEVANTDLRNRERELERENERLRSENEALKFQVAELSTRVLELEKLNGSAL